MCVRRERARRENFKNMCFWHPRFWPPPRGSLTGQNDGYSDLEGLGYPLQNRVKNRSKTGVSEVANCTFCAHFVQTVLQQKTGVFFGGPWGGFWGSQNPLSSKPGSFWGLPGPRLRDPPKTGSKTGASTVPDLTIYSEFAHLVHNL